MIRYTMLVLVLAGNCYAHCGYERWAVKTGQDSGVVNVSQSVSTSSVLDLSKLVSPLPKPKSKYPPQVNTRFDQERVVVSIKATIIRYRAEADQDIHCVISDGKHTMIAEIPNPACMDNLAGKKNMVTSPWVDVITATRLAFMAKTGYAPVPWSTKYGPPFITCNIPVTVTGVVFFDWPHKQSGAAPNSVELHPILSIVYE